MRNYIAKITDKFLIKMKFTKIYHNNLFKGSHSRSGEGSNLIQTQIIRKEIPLLLNDFKVKSLIDAHVVIFIG